MRKILILLSFVICLSVFSEGERIQNFEPESITILNERIRQLEDKVFQVKSSSSDGSPRFLDDAINDLPFLGVRSWSHDLTFSSTDNDTVAWTSGTITLSDENTTYSIGAGNTGTMASLTYIYLDTDTSSTALQTTTTAATSVGKNKILIAVAANVADASKYATYQVFGSYGLGTFIGVENIAANSITANELAVNTITANEIFANTITADEINTEAVGTDELVAEAVTTVELKTAMSAVSHTGNSWDDTVTLPGGQYGFTVQSKMSDTSSREWRALVSIGQGGSSAITGWTTYATNISLRGGQAGLTTYAQQRYVTASGTDLWIFLKANKVTGEIVSAWQAYDHPSYGNSGDSEKVPHPFYNYDSSKHEVVLIEKASCDSLKLRSQAVETDILTLINEDYIPNMAKTETYVPLHSGKFIDKAPVMIKTIPSYIKVRKLIRLTATEKTTREAEWQSIRQADAQAEAQKAIDRQSGINKLKTGGNLTNVEATALFE